jgi:hypothetical protein
VSHDTGAGAGARRVHVSHGTGTGTSAGTGAVLFHCFHYFNAGPRRTLRAQCGALLLFLRSAILFFLLREQPLAFSRRER